MKKTYIEPAIENLEMETQGFLANSIPVTDDAFEGGADDVLGRFDDFEEEE